MFEFSLCPLGVFWIFLHLNCAPKKYLFHWDMSQLKKRKKSWHLSSFTQCLLLAHAKAGWQVACLHPVTQVFRIFPSWDVPFKYRGSQVPVAEEESMEEHPRSQMPWVWRWYTSFIISVAEHKTTWLQKGWGRIIPFYTQEKEEDQDLTSHQQNLRMRVK